MGGRSSARHRLLRRALIALGVIVVLGVLALVYQTWRAGTALQQAQSQARTLQEQMVAGHIRSARKTSADLRESTHTARDNTDGVLFGLATHIPLLGRDAAAVRTSAEVLDTIARHSLPTLVHLAQQVHDGRLRPHHGRFDTAAIARMAPRVRRAANAVDPSARALAGVDADSLVFPLDHLVGKLQDKVATAHSAIDAAADAFEVLPGMLGAHGPRTYLLLIQNNAEIRATGGMPGSWAVLHAEHGKVTMGRQGAATDLGTTSRPVVRLTRAEKDLYGARLGTDLRDVTFTPDFPRAARMAAGILRAKAGIRVDGVVSVDPVSLGYVLAGTGPVRASGVRLTAADAAKTLLNGTYKNLPTEEQQDDFNEAAARAVFDAMVAGRGNQIAMIRGLVTAAGQHRILAWSRRPRIDAALRGNQLSGELPGDTGPVPQVGVYLDDAAASKMEFYLRRADELTSTRCTADGVQHLTLTTSLRSVAPRNITRLPSWVTGFGTVVPRGVIYVNVWVYAPAGGRITSLKLDGRAVTIGGGTHKGRQVAYLPVRIRPGGTHTLRIEMTTGRHQTHDPVLSTTPGMEPRADPVTVPSSCG